MKREIFQTINKINKLAFASVLSIITETLFTIADEAIIGRIDVDGYTAVSVSAGLIFQIIGNLGTISTSFVILFSKSVGRKNKTESENIFNSVMTISVVIGIIAEIMLFFFGKSILTSIYKLSGNILEEAYQYLIISGFTISLNLVCFIFSAYFKNMLNPKISVIAITASLPVNFIIDYVLVFGKFGFPRMRGVGAGIGTLCGILVETAVFIFFFTKNRKIKYHFSIKKDIAKKTLHIFIPVFFQDFFENTFFFVAIGAIIIRYNTVLYASYSVINAIISTVGAIVYSYAGSTMILVGQTFNSEKERNKCILYPKYASVLSFVLYTFILMIICFFPRQICSIITDQFQILEKAIPILIFALSVQVFNIPCQIYKYALQSIECEKYVFIVSTLLSAFCTGIIFTTVNFLELGLVGVFSGFCILYLLTDILFVAKFSFKLKKVY